MGRKDIFKIKKSKTVRGFRLYEFQDCYGQKCSLQASSLVLDKGSAIWFGVENTGLNLTGPLKNYSEDVFMRMHLTTKQVKQLLPILEKFVEQGELT